MPVAELGVDRDLQLRRRELKRMTCAQFFVELGWRRGGRVERFFAASCLFAQNGVVLDANRLALARLWRSGALGIWQCG